MRITRTLAAAFICATALALAAPQLSAQEPQPGRGGRLAPGQPVPRPPATVERPEQRPSPDFDQAVEEEMRQYRRTRPVLRVGQDFLLGKDEEVREVRVIFGDVVVEGHVTRDVIVVLGDARLASSAVVDGTLVVVGGTTTVDEGATVGGDMVVAAGNESAPPSFTPGGDHVVVGMPGLGPALRGIGPWFTRGLLWGRLIVPDLAWMWVVVGVVFLVSLLVNTLFDGTVRGTAETIVRRPLSSFLVGLLVSVLFVPAILILAATVIGLIVVPFLICALILAAIVGRVGINRAIGYGILRPESHEGRVQALLAFAIGFAVLVFVYMVPVIGVLTWALTGVMGLGAAATVFRAGLRREQPPRPAEPVPAPATAPAVAAAPAPVAYAEPVRYAEPAPGPVSAEPMAAGAIPVAPVDVPPAAVPPPPAPLGTVALAGFPRASFLDRAAAFVIDCILVAIAYQILDFGHRDGWYALMLFLYHVGFWAWKGTTLGGIICALRVVKVDGQELRFADSLVRGLTGIFSLVAVGIGCFWMLFDPQQQTWHDKIAGTYVVKVPRHMAVP